MIFHVTSPDGRTVEVTAPEGSTQEQAIKYAQDNWETLSKQSVVSKPAEKQPEAKEPSLIEQGANIGKEVLGSVAEPILKQATGMISKPIGEIAGLAASGYEAATGNKQSADLPQRFKEDVQSKLTYEPKTQLGKSEFNPLNAIPELAGTVIKGITPNAPEDSSNMKGMAANLVRELVPQAIGVAGVKYAPVVSGKIKDASQSLRSGAESLMQSALKPTLKDLKSGQAAVAIDTMLEKGLNVTSKGMESIRSRIDDLNEQIRQEIVNSPERVTTAKLARPLVEKLREFRKQVNPNADINAIKNSWNEFKNHPLIQGGEIPVQLAQELKQGTYKQLNKKYGQMGSAETEAQKTIARGLKEQIAEKVPSIEGLNKEETRLIKTLSVVERRVLMDANKNPLGLSTLAKNPAAWAAFMADKSALFKSTLARMMNNASQKLSGQSEGVSKGVASVSATAPNEVARQERKNRIKNAQY